MKKILLLTVLNLTFFLSYSQVGIGNTSPNANSILDLSNTNDKGFLLSEFTATFPAWPSGLLFMDTLNYVMFFNEGNGKYNGISPWRYMFDGNTSSNTYFDKSGNVGIGVGLSDPKKKLHVKDNGEIVRIEGSTSSFLTFYPKGSGSDIGSIGFLTSLSTLTIANGFLNNDIDITTLGAGNVNITNGDLVATNNIDAVSGKIKEGKKRGT